MKGMNENLALAIGFVGMAVFFCLTLFVASIPEMAGWKEDGLRSICCFFMSFMLLMLSFASAGCGIAYKCSRFNERCAKKIELEDE